MTRQHLGVFYMHDWDTHVEGHEIYEARVDQGTGFVSFEVTHEDSPAPRHTITRVEVYALHPEKRLIAVFLDGQLEQHGI